MKLMKITISLLCAAGASAFPQYAAKIPNGYGVPNPGPQGGIWAGVGHVRTAGGGDRNSFGLDFAANGFEWTTALCEADSDGDGRSNGEELGDPNCEWSEGEEPAGPALSHPGIADEAKEVATINECDNYVAPDDEITMDISFSVPTEMDETQTHYICEQKLVDVPAKELLHKVKHGVLLDNANVLHHMFVYICPEGYNSIDGDKVGQGPYDCSGNESGCIQVGGWAVGPHESCNPPNVGNELDFSGLDQIVVKIQAHYDNAMGTPQQDQSGIRLHMTPTLRPLIGENLATGMVQVDIDFLIPPQQTNYPLTSICPTAITEHLNGPVYVYAFTPHMHLYGKALVTEHYRCGKKIGELGRINRYEFDNQQTYSLNPPLKILPGDSFVTTCEYDTTGIDFDVVGGPETSDEMCLNFLSIYPKPGTAKVPTLLAGCFSFENGIKMDGREVSVRVAIGDRNRDMVTRDFISDPKASFGSCCAANNCEELYIAEVNEACGVDADCANSLVCAGGLCDYTGTPEDQDQSSPDETSDAAADSLVQSLAGEASGAAAIGNAVVSLIVLASLIGGCFTV
ncbi:Tyramine beta-hydroxylase [Seminavis robusta]|uniref:Tyramine beta-hydroxylase n=1 Tax=Seminavis robusta TaxID=568900 RepID=A0A9N8DG84_9STRA|nr:Tyramine beta-hydroxylase [Seminavis robusta]|eukprot:Sro76_g041550.1 Tyramine beta-hydroxylase (570) ;mRNA; f:37695-39404